MSSDADPNDVGVASSPDCIDCANDNSIQCNNEKFVGQATEPHDQRRAEYLSVVVFKPNPNASVGIGISFSEKRMCPVVTKIPQWSLLVASQVKMGDQVMSVNGIECCGLDASFARSIIAESKSTVTLLVRNPGGDPNFFTTQCMKPTRDVKLGISFCSRNLNRDDTSRDQIIVKKIHSQGPLVNSLVKEGHMIAAINGTSELANHLEALEMVRTSEDCVTIVSVCPPEPKSDSFKAPIDVRRLPCVPLDSALRTNVSSRSLGLPSALVATSAVANAVDATSNCDGANERNLLVLSSRNLVPLPLQRSEWLSVSIRKPMPDAAVGIGISKADDSSGQLYVSTIPSWSLLAGSQIEVGDQVVEVNGYKCDGMSVVSATHLIKQAPGIVTVVVRRAGGSSAYTTCQCIKLMSEKRLGIGLVSQQTKEEPTCELRVKKIDSDGLLAHSLLRVNDVVLSINDRSQWKSHEEALSWIRNSQDRCITILTPHIDAKSRPNFISTALLRPSDTTPLGFAIGINSTERKCVIASIVPFGLFSPSPIRVGDKVLSINGIDLTDLHRARLMCRELDGLQGKITVVVEVEGGDPSLVGAMVSKETPDSAVGIGLRNSQYGYVKISYIAADGLLANSLMNVGDKVLSINELNCRAIVGSTMPTSREASDVIKKATKTVTIIAKTRLDTGVVLSTDMTDVC